MLDMMIRLIIFQMGVYVYKNSPAFEDFTPAIERELSLSHSFSHLKLNELILLSIKSHARAFSDMKCCFQVTAELSRE